MPFPGCLLIFLRELVHLKQLIYNQEIPALNHTSAMNSRGEVLCKCKLLSLSLSFGGKEDPQVLHLVLAILLSSICPLHCSSISQCKLCMLCLLFDSLANNELT